MNGEGRSSSGARALLDNAISPGGYVMKAWHGHFSRAPKLGAFALNRDVSTATCDEILGQEGYSTKLSKGKESKQWEWLDAFGSEVLAGPTPTAKV